MPRLDDEAAWRLLADAPSAVLATLDADGSPHLVPFVYAALEDGSLISAVDSKPKRSRSLRRLDNIRRDPRVSVLVDHYEDDWSRLWWVRAGGTAVVVDEAPPGHDRLVERYRQYRDQTLGPWIVIDVERLVGWSASS